MFYVTSACPICLTGIIGFCRCGDNVSLALLCKDCNSMWDSPDHLDAAHALFPPHAGVRADGACRWASQSEIELRGWFELIFGELVSEPRDI